MKDRLGIKGFTIIESILAAVILGAAFVSLATLMAETTRDNIVVDVLANDIMLARRVMAITMAKSFDNVQTVTATSLGGNFSGYSYAVDVDYVERAALNNPVAYPTDYKRVIVMVSCTGVVDNVELQGLKVADGK